MLRLQLAWACAFRYRLDFIFQHPLPHLVILDCSIPSLPVSAAGSSGFVETAPPRLALAMQAQLSPPHDALADRAYGERHGIDRISIGCLWYPPYTHFLGKWPLLQLLRLHVIWSLAAVWMGKLMAQVDCVASQVGWWQLAQLCTRERERETQPVRHFPST